MSNGRVRLLRLFEHRVLRNDGLDAFLLLGVEGESKRFHEEHSWLKVSKERWRRRVVAAQLACAVFSSTAATGAGPFFATGSFFAAVFFFVERRTPRP